jgi:hypothetical protein
MTDEILTPAGIRDRIALLDENVDYLSNTLSNWSRDGFTHPNFPWIMADRTRFSIPPFVTDEFRRTTTQAISSGTWTGIQFDEIKWSAGIFGYSTASTGTFTFRRPPNKRKFLLFGRIEYMAVAGNYCSVRLLDLTTSTATVLSQLYGHTKKQTFSHLYEIADGTTGLSLQVFHEFSTRRLNAASFTLMEIGHG